MMATKTDKDIEKYLKAIKKKLIFPGKEKQRFIASMRDDIDSYLEEHKDAGIDGIISAFGTPDKIADEFASSIDHKKLKKAITLKRIIIVAVCIFLSVCVLVGITSLIDVYKSYNGYYVDSLLVETETGESLVYSERTEHDPLFPL